MYTSYFGLRERPFSITPDPRFLFLSERHREALAHLVYGAGPGGGFVLLTGEVGTGKTTVCRALIEQLPQDVDVAMILNPALTVTDLLITLCKELRVALPERPDSNRELVERLNAHLLEAHAAGRRTVLVIDEAQNLADDVMEEIRLLTNLETDRDKLLQIFLIGQPELRQVLSRSSLRQVAQRITARYHLTPLTPGETRAFIQHRLTVAGCSRPLFGEAALREIYRSSGGIPRLINVVCDRALLGAYAMERTTVDRRVARRAAREVFGEAPKERLRRIGGGLALASLVLFTVAVTGLAVRDWDSLPGLASDPEPRAEAARAGEPEHGSTKPAEQPSAKGPVAAERAAVVHTPVPPAPAAVEVAAPVENPGSVAAADSLAARLSAAQPASRGRGEQRLAALWSLVYEPAVSGDFCNWAEGQGLRCLRGRGTWNNLRLLNRPALLELVLEDGRRHPVVVTALGQERVSIDLGGEVAVFPIGALASYWYGDYLVLWQPPFASPGIVRAGDRGASVRWLKERFAELDGADPFAIDDYFDAPLEERVRDFQRRSFLAVDGVVGQSTLAHLSALLDDPQVPQLHSIGGS